MSTDHTSDPSRLTNTREDPTMTKSDDRCKDCGELSTDGHICPPLDPATVSILHTRVGVHMGDHAQDIVNAMRPDPGETVEQLIRRTLITTDWRGIAEVHSDHYVIIRVATEASR